MVVVNIPIENPEIACALICTLLAFSIYGILAFFKCAKLSTLPSDLKQWYKNRKMDKQ